MVMVGQDAPSDGAGGVLLKHFKERAGEGVHSLRRMADMICVLVAGRGYEEMEVAISGSMRREMPRACVVLAPRENFLVLSRRELPPDIVRRGHFSGME